MQFNRKYAAILSVGALLGTVGVVALQTHAQTPTTPAAVTQQTPAVSTPAATADTTETTTGPDTDNVQDGQQDAGNTADTQVNGVDTETNDDTNDKQEAPGTETQDDTTPAATTAK
jgi:cytoskeletal protein RodZ